MVVKSSILKTLQWAAIALLAVLLTSCALPPEAGPACTITLRPGDSLQAALDGAPAGAVICLPAGTWAESVRVTKPVTLRGAGPDRTTIRGTRLLHPVIAVAPEVEGEGAVVLVGITFTGATGSCAEPGGCAHGLFALGTAVVEVERCRFSGNTGTGVALRDEARVVLRDSAITDNGGFGVRVQGQAEAVLTSITISGHYGTGIWLSDQARLTLASSTVTKCEGHGLWVRDRSRLTATDSTISSCDGHGLWIRDQAVAELSGCTISDLRDAGVWGEHDAEVTLVGCVIQRAWDGIEARGNSRLQVTDCTVSEVRWNGIELHRFTQATIRNSRISGGRGSGIYLGGAAQAEIADNQIHSWISQGILSLSQTAPQGAGNLLSGNGVDLAGNVSGALRTPLVASVHEGARFPSPDYATLQEAVDAVQAGGRLILAAGIYPAGITLGKRIRIEAEGVVLLTAQSPHESAVLSLVGGADLDLVGVAIGRGSEGLLLGNDARAALTDCVVSDNLRGLHVQDAAMVQLLRCRVSRNEQGGMWLWGQAQGVLEECTFTQNAVSGIGVGGTATASITACYITESGRSGGIVLRDAAQAHLQGNALVNNDGAGVALYHGLCLGRGHVFTGRVTGGGNVFDGNFGGSVCPAALVFLSLEGGELDWRR